MKLCDRKGICIATFLLFLLFLATPAQASVVTFQGCKATLGGMYELSSTSVFHPNETIYVWINVTNEQRENIILKTESYRIDPNGISVFIDRSDVIIPAKEGDNVGFDIIPVDGWNVSQNVVFGSYSYNILYSAYWAGNGSLAESSGVRYENLYKIEGGPTAPAPTILSIKILDKSSVPIPRARVYIDDQFKGSTYSTGMFNLQDPPQGMHSIKISKSGYREAVYNADIKTGKTNSLTLKLDRLNDTITVSPAPTYTPRPIPGFEAIFIVIALLAMYRKKYGHL